MDPYSVPPKHSHYLMKLLLARLPQNRKEELSVHLFPKALDLMIQNNLWGKLLPFVPCWFKYRSHFVGSRFGAPNQFIPQQQSAIPPPASVKSGPSRELGTIDWAAPPSEPLPQNTLVITPPLTPTNVGEPVLTLPLALAFEDPLSNPYQICYPVQSFYLIKLLLARLPIFERAKVANQLLVLATGFMHKNRLWHELSPFNPTWSKLPPQKHKAIQTSDIQLHDPHVEDPLINVALREFNNEQTFYLLKLLLARLPTHLWPKVFPSTTGASTSGSVDAIPTDFNWSASDTATTSATNSVDDWSPPPAPNKLVVPEVRQPALAKESVVSAVPVAVTSQPVPPAQSRPSDYSPSKPNYNSNDNSRNGYVEQYRQPPPPPQEERSDLAKDGDGDEGDVPQSKGSHSSTPLPSAIAELKDLLGDLSDCSAIPTARPVSRVTDSQYLISFEDDSSID